MDGEDPEPAIAPAVETGLGADEAGSVHLCVRSLPREQQQAIELSFFSGLTHHEIAASLGQPLGTVKARIRRGVLRLRDCLEGRL